MIDPSAVRGFSPSRQTVVSDRFVAEIERTDTPDGTGVLPTWKPFHCLLELIDTRTGSVETDQTGEVETSSATAPGCSPDSLPPSCS